MLLRGQQARKMMFDSAQALVLDWKGIWPEMKADFLGFKTMFFCFVFYLFAYILFIYLLFIAFSSLLIVLLISWDLKVIIIHAWSRNWSEGSRGDNKIDDVVENETIIIVSFFQLLQISFMYIFYYWAFFLLFWLI